MNVPPPLGPKQNGRKYTGKQVSHHIKDVVFIHCSNTPDGVAELRARWEADLSRTELPPPPPEVHATKQEGIDVREQYYCIATVDDSNDPTGGKKLRKGPRLCPGHWPFIQGQGEHFCFL